MGSASMETIAPGMGITKGLDASVRQVLLDELVDISTEVITPMAMQGQVKEGWPIDQPTQTYRTERVLEST